VPLQKVNLSNLSLLREFHFSTTVQAMYQNLMGRTPLPLHWEVQIAVEADPLQNQTNLRLNIHVKDHHRRFQVGGEIWEEYVARYFAGVDEPISNAELRELGLAERGRYISEILHALFFRIKTSLYEYDPRVGHNPARDGPLPTCPLLDPGEPLARMGVFMPILLQHSPSILVDDRTIGTHCPLCEGEIDGSQEYIWGGCNMLWVHADCWRAT